MPLEETKQDICDAINARVKSGKIIKPLDWTMDILSAIGLDDDGDYQVRINQDYHWYHCADSIIQAIARGQSYSGEISPITLL